MTGEANLGSPEQDAALAVALLATDPWGLAGAMLRAQPGPSREDWLHAVRRMLPVAAPYRRIPLHVSDDRLLGGIDLAATLSAGRPVLQRGLLNDCDGGVALLAMAERMSRSTASRVAAAIDGAETTRLAVIALDERLDDAERVPECLADRLALHVDLRAVDPSPLRAMLADLASPDVMAARARLTAVAVGDEAIGALCGAACAFGIVSLRVAWLATRVARAHAAWRGGTTVEQVDAVAAARLVLAPRALMVPPMPADDRTDGCEPSEAADGQEAPGAQRSGPTEPGAMGETVVQATRAALPPALLAG
jgi:magnesium chelatase subunit D